MKIKTKIKSATLTVLTLLSGLTPPAVFAHSGHIADSSLHSLLHGEHVLVLALAAAVSLAVYASRK